MLSPLVASIAEPSKFSVTLAPLRSATRLNWMPVTIAASP
jgi:hypothetical protein